MCCESRTRLVELRGFAEQSGSRLEIRDPSVTQVMKARAHMWPVISRSAISSPNFLASSRLARRHPPSRGSRASRRAHRCKLIARSSPPLVPRARALKGVSSPTRQGHPVAQFVDPSLILQPGSELGLIIRRTARACERPHQAKNIRGFQRIEGCGREAARSAPSLRIQISEQA
jgi:hypothetical protein